MEKDRSRGIKHIKDKQKYKGNSTKNAKYIPPKNKPLSSNWDRYEDDESNEHELSSGTDFELLASAPISSGSFYESKTNQVIEEAIEKQKSGSNLFCLDLDVLTRSVAAVPFYEIIGIDKKYFTNHEISEFDQEAARNLENLNDFVKQLTPVKSKLENDNSNSINKLKDNSGSSKINNPTEKIQHILSEVESSNTPQEIFSQKSESSLVNNDKISELISNIELEKKEPNIEIKSAKESEDLEQWLDDILDE